MSEPAAVALSQCLERPSHPCIASMQLCRFTWLLGSLLFFSDLIAALLSMVLPECLSWEIDKIPFSQHLFDLLGTVSLPKALESALVVCGMLFLFHRGRQYQVRFPWRHEARQVVLVATVIMLAYAVLRWFLSSMLPDMALIVSWAGAVMLTLAGRQGVRTFLRQRHLGRLPIVVVGNETMVANTIEPLEGQLGLDYRVVGSVDPFLLNHLDERDYRHDLQQRCGGAQAIVLLDETPTTVAVAERLLRQGLLAALLVSDVRSLDRCQNASGFRKVFALHADAALWVPHSRINDPISRSCKRILDVVGAVVGILFAATVLAPFFLWIAWRIKADGGPLFFRQRRVGYQGRLFECLKLRTMAMDAEQTLRQELLRDPETAKEWKQDCKLRHDPRVTPIGRFLRRTSIDELPQLLNVLRGDMSLVGARPIVPNEIERYGEDAAYYLRSRPGLTGLWQVSGRNNLDYAMRVRLDASYVRNWTLGYDLAILLRTIPVLLTGYGAY